VTAIVLHDGNESENLSFQRENRLEWLLILRPVEIKKGAPAWLPSFRHLAFESDILSHLTFIIPKVFFEQRKISGGNFFQGILFKLPKNYSTIRLTLAYNNCISQFKVWKPRITGVT
jgi:hypothetical protein